MLSQFDLVCDKAILNQLVSTVYMIGGLIGSLSSGAISDRHVGYSIVQYAHINLDPPTADGVVM